VEGDRFVPLTKRPEQLAISATSELFSSAVVRDGRLGHKICTLVQEIVEDTRPQTLLTIAPVSMRSSS
jgi:hypothetical protein